MWHLPTGACLAAFSCGGAQFERAVRKLCWLPRTGGCGAAPWPLLAACSEDGGVQVWEVQLPNGLLSGSSEAGSVPAGADAQPEAPGPQPQVGCRLLARFAAAHLPQDCISAVCLGEAAGDGAAASLRLWTGDSSGHVALWDLSSLVAVHVGAAAGAPPAAAPAPALPRRLAHWRAAEAPVVSLDCLVPGRGLLLVGAQDASVGVWTAAGGLVGVFGRHTWDLDAPATWQDPHALAPPPPLPADAGGSGLTPRELIANTPRRSSWAVRGGASAGSGAASARHLGGGGSGSAAGSALPSARSLRGSASNRGAEPLAGAAEGRAGQSGEAAQRPALAGLAEALSSLAQLRLPIAEEPAEWDSSTDRPVAGAPGAPASCQQTAAQPGAGTEHAGSTAGSSPVVNAAGARLAALAADAAVRKADRWAIPVHVQAHSALALQSMEAVPVGTGGATAALLVAVMGNAGCRGCVPAHLLCPQTPPHASCFSILAIATLKPVTAPCLPSPAAADMWAAVKASGKVSGYSGAGEREAAARAASPGPPRGRRSSAAAPSIVAIMGRSATAFGRRATQPHAQ